LISESLASKKSRALSIKDPDSIDTVDDHTDQVVMDSTASLRHNPQAALGHHINGSTRMFLNTLVIQYTSGSKEESTKAIRDTLVLAEEAEDAKQKLGDTTSSSALRQIILCLEDLLLRIFEDDDIASAHTGGLLRYQAVPDLMFY
jgi:hypothetical protein